MTIAEKAYEFRKKPENKGEAYPCEGRRSEFSKDGSTMRIGYPDGSALLFNYENWALPEDCAGRFCSKGKCFCEAKA